MNAPTELQRQAIDDCVVIINGVWRLISMSSGLVLSQNAQERFQRLRRHLRLLHEEQEFAEAPKYPFVMKMLGFLFIFRC